MRNLEDFNRKYPTQTTELSTGKLFTYRYYKKPTATATIILLTGGIGLSDLLYLHFEKFAETFSVLTFDYQIQFKDNNEFARAVAELLQILKEKVWLVGQSLGGIVAQIIAANYPENIEGIVLSNTCSLEKDMGEDAYLHLMNMIKGQRKVKKLLSVIPFALYKKLMKWAVVKKKTGSFSQEEKLLMENLCNAMVQLLTKPYSYHMIDFLIDAHNHFGMSKKTFQIWDNKVLLILSEDDNVFNQPCKDSLIHIMTNPTVITDIAGGHLALLVNPDKYVDTICSYIVQRTE